MLTDSRESKAIISACFLLERMQQELKDLPTCSRDALTEWHSRSEFRLAQLLEFAERAQLPAETYKSITEIVCTLYKPLTGKVDISHGDIARIDGLLARLDNEKFCCWMI